MHPSTKKPRTWLLSVASAGTLLPGCADEPTFDDEVDAHEAGHAAEAGIPVGAVSAPDGGFKVPDAGWMGTVLQPDAGLVDVTHPIGTVPRPDSGAPFVGVPPLVDAAVLVGSVPQPDDAGPADAGEADADAQDAGCRHPVIVNGIVLIPADASCMPYYPGVVPRSVDGGD
jgi:hypothetical protein